MAFIFWSLSVLIFTNAFNIVTNIDNAVQYIQQIVLTSDWTSSWTTWVILDGPSSKVWSDRYCDKWMTNCKKFPTIVTTWDIVGFLTWWSLSWYLTWWWINILAKTNLSCSNNQIPKFNWSAWVCWTDTDTDKYISSASFANWIITLSGAWWGTNVSVNLDWRYRTWADLFQINWNYIYYNGVANIWIWLVNPSYKLDVNWMANINGSIKISQTNSTCTSANEWEIIYNWSCFRWCNWVTWTDLSNCSGWACWSSHNINSYTVPSSNLCLIWTPSSVTNNNISNGLHNRTRTCDVPGVSTASCWANKKIDWQCNTTHYNCTYWASVNHTIPSPNCYYRDCQWYNWWITDSMCEDLQVGCML